MVRCGEVFKVDDVSPAFRGFVNDFRVELLLK